MAKVLKVVGLSVSTLFVLAYAYLLWKLNRPPRRPDVMPEAAIWIEAPPNPFQFTYRGLWLGCRNSAGSGVQCAITDWDGTPEYEDTYVPCDDPKRVVSDISLQFAPMDWENTYGGFVFNQQTDKVSRLPVVRLMDGTTLLPVTHYDDVKEYLERANRDYPDRGCQLK